MNNTKELARMQELIPLLNRASKAYYQEDREIMSNFEYDSLSDELLKLDSPAAKFVRGIGEKFNIPCLLTTGAIKKYQKKINTLAKQIEGADLLPKGSYLWSCLRGIDGYAWVANSGGFFYDEYTYYTFVVVPVAVNEA